MSLVATFRRLSLRHLAAHKLRTLFTMFGVALGVAAMIAIQLMYESVARSYERTVEQIAGKAGLQITNGEVGVPEELLDEVRTVAEVAAASASVHGFLPITDRPGDRLYVLGVDLLADQALREYELRSEEGEIEDPVLFLAQPDSVAVTTAFLEETGFENGDPFTVSATGGPLLLTIRARIDAERGPATLFAGRLAVMDLFAAQRLFGLDRRFTQIDVGLEPGAEIEAVRSELERVVAGRGVVERPETRGEVLERMLASIRYGLTVAASLTILVGLYLVFNTMMIAVAQRRREIGILRCVGMRRAELIRLVGLESLVLGAIGCAAGVPLGFSLAKGMSAAFISNVSTLYLPVGVSEVALRPEPVLLGVVLGLLSSLVAAGIPAAEALRVRPLETLRPSSTESRTAGRYGRALVAGLAVLAATVGLWVGRRFLPLGEMNAGRLMSLGMLVGVSLIVPGLVRASSLRSERLLAKVLGAVGLLASRALVSHVGRLAVTSSAFVVSLTAAIAIATIVTSVQTTFLRWFDSAFSAIDLVVTAGEAALSRSSAPMPGRVAEEIATISGVALVDRVRLAKVSYRGSLITIGSSDVELFRKDLRRTDFVEGDRTSGLEALAQERGVIVNEAFSRKFHLGAGDEIALPTPSGELRLPVVGVYFEVDDVGGVWMDQRLYRRLWRDDAVNFVEIVLDPGVSPATAAREIRERLGRRHDLFVMTTSEFRREGERLIGQTAALSYPLVAIAIAIALLGIVNSLLAAVLDRFREIGLLRVAGATRRQVAASVVVECAVVGLLGGLFAAIAGSVVGYYQVDIVGRVVFALTVFYSYPVSETAFALVASVVLATLAGLVPGRAAARLRITDTLKYE